MQVTLDIKKLGLTLPDARGRRDAERTNRKVQRALTYEDLEMAPLQESKADLDLSSLSLRRGIRSLFFWQSW